VTLDSDCLAEREEAVASVKEAALAPPVTDLRGVPRALACFSSAGPAQ
jgi:hypothetical protein